MRKHFYVNIFAKLSKEISEERDLISKVPVICCDLFLVLSCFFFLILYL